MIRTFTMEDYDEVYQLWKNTPGVGLRNMDDSKEGIERYVNRNPDTSFVAVEDERIVGVVLGGHDGRRGFLYHACVEEAYRKKAIGKELVEHVIESIKKENITRFDLVCFTDNSTGNSFWDRLGWNKRSDLNFYTLCVEECSVDELSS